LLQVPDIAVADKADFPPGLKDSDETDYAETVSLPVIKHASVRLSPHLCGAAPFLPDLHRQTVIDT
jgi:hypothetical protein